MDPRPKRHRDKAGAPVREKGSPAAGAPVREKGSNAPVRSKGSPAAEAADDVPSPSPPISLWNAHADEDDIASEADGSGSFGSASPPRPKESCLPNRNIKKVLDPDDSDEDSRSSETVEGDAEHMKTVRVLHRRPLNIQH